MNFQTTIIAAVLASALGFGLGFYTEGKFSKTAEVTQQRQDTKQTATNVVEATQSSAAIDTGIAVDGAQIDKIKEAAAARVAKYQPKPESIHAERTPDGLHAGARDQQPANQQPTTAGEPLAQVDCPRTGLVLDAGTVRLLNAAAEGADVGAAGGSNGQEPAAAGPAR